MRTMQASDVTRRSSIPGCCTSHGTERSQGMGAALLRAAEDVVRRRGGQLLEIDVDGDDVDPRRFYERHGYRNAQHGRDEQLLCYLRELPPA